MAYKNAHITDTEALEIADEFSEIAKYIEESSKRLDKTTDILITGAKGQEIDELRTWGKKLIGCIGDLAVSAMDCGWKIGEFINAMIANDKEAAERIKNSFR